MVLGSCHVPGSVPCEESELTWVEDQDPAGEVVDSLTPVLTWSYPDPTCRPGLYRIRIFDDDLVGDRSHPPTPIHEVETTVTSYRVPASVGLQPANTYTWGVTAMTADGRGGGASVVAFSVGPLCGDLASLEAPIPLYPPNGQQVQYVGTIHLVWDNPMTCWPDRNFYLQISTAADFTEMVFTGNVGPYEHTMIPYETDTFEDCRLYYWRVRAEPAGGGWGPFSETWSFIPRRTEAICPLTFGITPIPPEWHIPWLTLLEDAACWSGPSMEYLILDYLTPGQELEIQGRDQGGGWWYVDDPAIHKACWVFGEHVQANGDLSQVPIQQAPPAPTRTPTIPPPASVNCGQYSNPNSCGGDPACQWVTDVQHPNGGCVNK
jgi:hypothetical protein